MSSLQPNPFSLKPDQPAVPASPYLDERLSVETPEQIRLQFTIAGIGSRFLAIAIDALIQAVGGGLVGILLIVGGIALSKRISTTTGIWLAAFVVLFYFVLYFGYFVLFEIFWNGQTPGKRAIGIRVIKESGRPLTEIEVIGRNLLRIVDQLPSFYIVGIVTALCNAQSKRLGDFVAGSIVVQDKGLPEGIRPWEAAPVRSSTSGFRGLTRLTPEEFTLVEAYRSRRAELELGIRHRMAGEILERIGRRIPLTTEELANADRTLEALGQERPFLTHSIQNKPQG